MSIENKPKSDWEVEHARSIERDEEYYRARMAELEAITSDSRASTIERAQGQADRTRDIDSVIAHRKAIEGLLERQTNVMKEQVVAIKDLANALREAKP